MAIQSSVATCEGTIGTWSQGQRDAISEVATVHSASPSPTCRTWTAYRLTSGNEGAGVCMEAPSQDLLFWTGAIEGVTHMRARTVWAWPVAAIISVATMLKLMVLVAWHSIRYPNRVSVIDYNRKTVYTPRH